MARPPARLVVLVSLVVALCFGVMVTSARAESSAPTQSVVTLDLHSKYVSHAQAVTGLSGVTEQQAGPTGLRTWVVLPAGYSASQCYPVLYLLHASQR